MRLPRTFLADGRLRRATHLRHRAAPAAVGVLITPLWDAGLIIIGA
jgi:hypothetical protein